MKLIIPMAGRGTRVRPHSHVTPKPLLNVRGKNMVERIVETFVHVLPRPLTEAVFILGPDFGDGVRRELTAVSERHGMRAEFRVQERAQGTGHAVAMAGDRLEGEGVVVFADTLFYMEPDVNLEADVIVWVKEVEDPSRFGVAVRKGEQVVEFVEKPTTLVSREAIIGIYYFKDLAKLRAQVDYLMANNVTGHGGEYQLTDALDALLKNGSVVKTATVTEWLDCGTIDALLDTTKVILEKEHGEPSQGEVENSIVIEPVYIGPGAKVAGSVVGPHVSIEAGAQITGSVVRESIVFGKARIEDAVLQHSLIGASAVVQGRPSRLNIGDHSEVA